MARDDNDDLVPLYIAASFYLVLLVSMAIWAHFKYKRNAKEDEIIVAHFL
jgi:hypothetical protein